MKILDEYKIDIEGKKVVIAGRSSLVGLPLFHILLNRNATITLCHSHTKNLNVLTKEADIVIAAVGKANLIT
jgi:methylenetetrahydrofolate dehydrogenase (NADP+)/methenyltetrahydrofolate cyclohydrolase